MTGLEVLSIPMTYENDANASTIGQYLIALLDTLWDEGQQFSGKRPFGNSDWEYDLYKPLIVAGVVPGKLDEYGDVEELNEDAAHSAIFEAIAALGNLLKEKPGVPG